MPNDHDSPQQDQPSTATSIPEAPMAPGANASAPAEQPGGEPLHLVVEPQMQSPLIATADPPAQHLVVETGMQGDVVKSLTGSGDVQRGDPSRPPPLPPPAADGPHEGGSKDA